MNECESGKPNPIRGKNKDLNFTLDMKQVWGEFSLINWVQGGRGKIHL